jgi:hypothetical protein
MKSSSFLSLNVNDLIKGIIMAFLAAFLITIYGVLNGGGFPSHSEWVDALHAAITATLAYLLKNVFTNSQDQFLKTEQK